MDTMGSQNESIYVFVIRHMVDGKYDGEPLPDSEKISAKYKLKGIHFAHGLLDDYQLETTDQDKIKKVCNLLEAISAGEDKKTELYQEIISSERAISLLGGVTKELESRHTKITANLEVCAQWLMTESMDREPVKFGIFLYGLVSGNPEPVLNLILCEEFSLFAGIALMRNAKETTNIEEMLIDFAKKLEGWGKIQLVRVMTAYLRQIKNTDWFLFEGWKNNIGPQVALRCAISGKLNQAVEIADLDKIIPLVEELISDFNNKGKSLNDYEYTIPVLKKIIERLEQEQMKIEYLLYAKRILNYLSDKEITDESKALGWSDDVKKELIEQHQAYTARNGWSNITERIIEGDDLDLANRAASILGIDIWNKNFNYISEHQEELKNHHPWFNLMSDNNEERARKVLGLGLKILPLDKYCTGPDTKTGFEEDSSDTTTSLAISAILQIIEPFPGSGSEFLAKSLNSPMIRDRNMSLNVIEKWSMDDLEKAGLLDVLRDVLQKEPEESIKKRIEKILTDIK